MKKTMLSIQKKNRLLLTGCFLASWLMYVLAIQPTLTLKNECQAMTLQLDSSVNAPDRLQNLKEELKTLEDAAEENSGSVHEQLLGVVTNYCTSNDLVLRDFAPALVNHREDMTIETHTIKVEGSYAMLLKLVHHLEKEKKGKIVSVDFVSRKDNKTGTLSLTATIYVQNVIKQ